MHYGGTAKVATTETIYDTVLVGEGMANLDVVRETVKHWEPYILTLTDMSRAEVDNDEELYLHSIPYMQFPFRLDGRPFTGERACVEGIDYHDDFWTHHLRRQWEHTRAHPDGPHAYGFWDSCPPNPKRHELWSRYFELYRPMVKEGTRAYLEIAESSLFSSTPPNDVVASLFVNEETYLVLANYGSTSCTIDTSHVWQDRRSSRGGRQRELPARGMTLLRKLA